MSINKYRPHVLVLPEDDANRRIANGFLLYPDLDERRIQVLPPAGGWNEVLEHLRDVHAREMSKYLQRRMVLLIDFDEDSQRLSDVRKQISKDLTDRVFVLGVFSEPERLKTAIGKTLEEIGKALAQDCVNDTRTVWGHNLLNHNEGELDHMNRTVPSVAQVLFPCPGRELKPIEVTHQEAAFGAYPDL
ncbi:MAG: hypothetical protein V1792_27820 [Pseudomonadota bacterium]